MAAALSKTSDSSASSVASGVLGVPTAPSWPLPLPPPLAPGEEEALACFRACLRSPFVSVRDQGLYALRAMPSLVPHLFEDLLSVYLPEERWSYACAPLFSFCSSLPTSAQESLVSRLRPFFSPSKAARRVYDLCRSLPALPSELFELLEKQCASPPSDTFEHTALLAAFFKHKPSSLLTADDQESLHRLPRWGITGYVSRELFGVLRTKYADFPDLMRAWMHRTSAVHLSSEFSIAAAIELWRLGEQEGSDFLLTRLASRSWVRFEPGLGCSINTEIQSGLLEIGRVKEAFESLFDPSLVSASRSLSSFDSHREFALFEPERALQFFQGLLGAIEEVGTRHELYGAIGILGPRLKALEPLCQAILRKEIRTLEARLPYDKRSVLSYEDEEEDVFGEERSPLEALPSLLRLFSKGRFALPPSEQERLRAIIEGFPQEPGLAEGLFEYLVERGEASDLSWLCDLYLRTPAYLQMYRLSFFKTHFLSSFEGLRALLDKQIRHADTEIQLSAKRLLLAFPAKTAPLEVQERWLALAEEEHPEIRMAACCQIAKGMAEPLSLAAQVSVAKTLRALVVDVSLNFWRVQALHGLAELFSRHPALGSAAFSWEGLLWRLTSDLQPTTRFVALSLLAKSGERSARFQKALVSASSSCSNASDAFSLGTFFQASFPSSSWAALRSEMREGEGSLLFRLGRCLSFGGWPSRRLRLFLFSLFEKVQTFLAPFDPIPSEARVQEFLRVLPPLLEDPFSSETSQEELLAVQAACKRLAEEYSNFSADAFYPWHHEAFFGYSSFLEALALFLSPSWRGEIKECFRSLGEAYSVGMNCSSSLRGVSPPPNPDLSVFCSFLQEMLPTLEASLSQAEREAEEIERFQATAEEHLFSSP